MNHREAVEALTNGRSANLPARLLAELQGHVEECDECRGWEGDYQLFATAARDAIEHLPTELLAREAVEPETLTAAERSSVEEHLQQCEDCRRDLELTTQALSESEETSVTRVSQHREVPSSAVSWRLAIAASLILALVVGFKLTVPQVAPEHAALEERVLQAASLAGTQVVDSEGSLTVQATKIESGSDVRFRAGESVALGEGFSIESGASLQIEIDDSLGHAQ